MNHRIQSRLQLGCIAALLLTLGVSLTCQAQGSNASDLTLSGPAYGDSIPRQFTCDGAGLSPPLKWSGVPQGTKSLVFLLDDPDAPGGTYVHWILYNIPPGSHGLPKKASPDGLPRHTRTGTGSSGKAAYHGPCPPSGTHRYVHKLYALNTRLRGLHHPDKKALLKAMRGHILSRARLVVPYTRQQ